MYFVDTFIGFLSLFISKEWLFIVSVYTLASIGISVVFGHLYQYSKYRLFYILNRLPLNQLPLISKWIPNNEENKLLYMIEYLESSLKQIQTEIESIPDDKVKTDVFKMFQSVSNYFHLSQQFLKSKYDSVSVEIMRTKTKQVTDEIFDLIEKYR